MGGQEGGVLLGHSEGKLTLVEGMFWECFHMKPCIINAITGGAWNKNI